MPDPHAPLARTPLHAWHQTHGARFSEHDGWHVVAAYAEPESEAAAARAGLGLADVSACAKFAFRGAGVAELAHSLFPDSAGLPVGSAAPIPGRSVLACRLTDEHLLLLGGDAPALAGGARSAVLIDVTSAYAGFELIGPRLDEVLPRLTGLDLRPAAFPAGSCRETAFCGVEGLLVRTPGRRLPALLVLVAWDLGEYVWERILDAGRDVPITPVGMQALALL
jgi:glycine cleavage system aminomethyltransferase T